MKNQKSSNELAQLRQDELTARNAYIGALSAYCDGLNTSTNTNTISCGDERFPIIEKVIIGFEEDPNISYPEEVEKDEFVNDADEYKYLMGIVTQIEKVKAKANGVKINLGSKLADNFQTIHSHVTLKAEKNKKYEEIAKTTAVYHDPNGKRKETKLEKQRTKRASKKNPPEI
ncbi:MAG: hypothetical protein JNL70_03880 [Saprospiraceae bacterium]|nr:hypothetical protein [Saprospiraceae bacterium]